MKNAMLALMMFVTVQGAAMSGAAAAQDLLAMVGHDHFAATPDGLYTGVADGPTKARLNAKIDAAATALANASTAKASIPGLLAVLKEQLAGIERDTLDTEDAEHVAGLFERMLDDLGIQGPDGIINDWLYGFDPI